MDVCPCQLCSSCLQVLNGMTVSDLERFVDQQERRLCEPNGKKAARQSCHKSSKEKEAGKTQVTGWFLSYTKNVRTFQWIQRDNISPLGGSKATRWPLKLRPSDAYDPRITWSLFKAFLFVCCRYSGGRCCFKHSVSPNERPMELALYREHTENHQAALWYLHREVELPFCTRTPSNLERTCPFGHIHVLADDTQNLLFQLVGCRSRPSHQRPLLGDLLTSAAGGRVAGRHTACPATARAQCCTETGG